MQWVRRRRSSTTCSAGVISCRYSWTSEGSHGRSGAAIPRQTVSICGRMTRMMDRRQWIAAAGATAALGVATAAQRNAADTESARVPVIDIHTHMYTRRWLEALKASGDADTVVVPGTPESIAYRGVNYAILAANMFDWEQRIAQMDEAGV